MGSRYQLSRAKLLSRKRVIPSRFIASGFYSRFLIIQRADAPRSIVLPDVAVGFVEKLLVGVELVFEERPAEGLADFPLALAGGLPVREAHLLHDGINVRHDPLDDDMGVLALHFVEKLGQGGEGLILFLLGISLLLGLDSVSGDFEDGFEEFQAVEKALFVLFANLFQAFA